MPDHLGFANDDAGKRTAEFLARRFGVRTIAFNVGGTVPTVQRVENAEFHHVTQNRQEPTQAPHNPVQHRIARHAGRTLYDN